MKTTILVVEDEPAIQELIAVNLRLADYTVQLAQSAEQAQELIQQALPDLIILDWMLPGVQGLQFAKELRRQTRTKQIPLIMLTAKGAEQDRVAGLEAGADDYITKPFSPKELRARINAVLRRSAPQLADETVSIAGLLLDPRTHRVHTQITVDQPPSNSDSDVQATKQSSQEQAHAPKQSPHEALAGLPDSTAKLHLGPTEFRLLHFFMTHPERVFSRTQLLDTIWGDHVFIEERTVDVHIRRLRKALAPSGHDKHIETVRGAGYRFAERPEKH